MAIKASPRPPPLRQPSPPWSPINSSKEDREHLGPVLTPPYTAVHVFFQAILFFVNKYKFNHRASSVGALASLSKVHFWYKNLASLKKASWINLRDDIKGTIFFINQRGDLPTHFPGSDCLPTQAITWGRGLVKSGTPPTVAHPNCNIPIWCTPQL